MAALLKQNTLQKVTDIFYKEEFGQFRTSASTLADRAVGKKKFINHCLTDYNAHNITISLKHAVADE